MLSEPLLYQTPLCNESGVRIYQLASLVLRISKLCRLFKHIFLKDICSWFRILNLWVTITKGSGSMIFGYFKIANISYCIIFDVLLFICKIYITSMVCLSSTCTVFGVIYTHTPKLENIQSHIQISSKFQNKFLIHSFYSLR